MIAPGTRLGNYEVVAALGAGAMGEVYRARDTRLGRDVAIKVLPETFVADPDRLERFEREARLLAALNHPNIAAIYGVEEAAPAAGSGQRALRALVLELVEGETLEEVLGRGPRPAQDSGGPKTSAAGHRPGRGLRIDEALVLARQIAEALEAAHEQGIVHRDLKPANIKITASGRVKVLDFGLAKAAAMRPDPDRVETLRLGETQAGVIVGTAAYMSPEQARARPVDKRTDIWAFGCVLFEMLAGRPPFEGDTFSDLMAAVLDREPAWAALPSATPSNVRRLLRKCLEKDAARRLRDIGDARLEIDDALGGAADDAAPSSAAAPTRPARLGQPRALAVAVLLISAAAVLGWYVRGRRTGEPAAPRFDFTQLTAEPGVEWYPSLSPDAKWIVYSGEASGNRDIYLQSVTGQTAINLTKESPADDDEPAFSPDGERIAFRSSRDGGGIFIMGRTGEAARRLTRGGFKPAWSPDGREIAYVTEHIELNPQNSIGGGQLFVVSVEGGEPRLIHEGNAVLPSWSPHGARIAFMKNLGAPAQAQIWSVPARGGTATAVTTDSATNWNPIWSPDGRYLFFTSDRGGTMNLWRIPVDETSGRPRGQPEPMTVPAPYVAHPSWSSDGRRLAYTATLMMQNIQKLAFDPATRAVRGDPAWLTSGSRPWSSPDPSPDGGQVAFYSRVQPEGDLYISRSDGTGLRQVTSDPMIDRVPRWSPDGRWLAFHSNRSGPLELWKIRPDGSELQQLTAAGNATYAAWSPDGTRMATTAAPPTDAAYIFDPTRPWSQQKPEPLPRVPGSTNAFMVNDWSPDGERLIGQAGFNALGIESYAIRSRTFERLTTFGEWPVWLPDSRHVLFVSGGKDLFIVDRDSKQVQKIYSVARDVIGPPRLSRDGRTIYLSRRITEADIWVATVQ